MFKSLSLSLVIELEVFQRASLIVETVETKHGGERFDSCLRDLPLANQQEVQRLFQQETTGENKTITKKRPRPITVLSC
jgi:hypothetical protein